MARRFSMPPFKSVLRRLVLAVPLAGLAANLIYRSFTALGPEQNLVPQIMIGVIVGYYAAYAWKGEDVLDWDIPAKKLPLLMLVPFLLDVGISYKQGHLEAAVMGYVGNSWTVIKTAAPIALGFLVIGFLAMLPRAFVESFKGSPVPWISDSAWEVLPPEMKEYELARMSGDRDEMEIIRERAYLRADDDDVAHFMRNADPYGGNYDDPYAQQDAMGRMISKGLRAKGERERAAARVRQAQAERQYKSKQQAAKNAAAAAEREAARLRKEAREERRRQNGLL